MNIAILGATSQIAQDLILSFSNHKDYDLFLFSRNLGILNDWVGRQNLYDNMTSRPIEDIYPFLDRNEFLKEMIKDPYLK